MNVHQQVETKSSTISLAGPTKIHTICCYRQSWSQLAALPDSRWIASNMFASLELAHLQRVHLAFPFKMVVFALRNRWCLFSADFLKENSQQERFESIMQITCCYSNLPSAMRTSRDHFVGALPCNEPICLSLQQAPTGCEAKPPRQSCEYPWGGKRST